MGDLEEVPGSWLWPGLGLVFVAVWGVCVYQQLKDHSLSLFFGFPLYSNFFK